MKVQTLWVVRRRICNGEYGHVQGARLDSTRNDDDGGVTAWRALAKHVKHVHPSKTSRSKTTRHLSTADLTHSHFLDIIYGQKREIFDKGSNTKGDIINDSFDWVEHQFPQPTNKLSGFWLGWLLSWRLKRPRRPFYKMDLHSTETWPSSPEYTRLSTTWNPQ